VEIDYFHFHLLIETPLGNLNKLMQNINTSYTVWINKKYRRSGHLFQGRYKAILVDKVANFYSITQEDLRRRTRKNIRQRKLVIYLTKTICQKSNTEIGKYFGISTQAVTNVLKQKEDQFSKSRIVKKELEILNV
jgi:chromosomal replication initiation ATPase DnaA